MLLDKDERRQMTQLFEHLSAVESEDFTPNDVQNLANKYIWPPSPNTLLHVLDHRGVYANRPSEIHLKLHKRTQSNT